MSISDQELRTFLNSGTVDERLSFHKNGWDIEIRKTSDGAYFYKSLINGSGGQDIIGRTKLEQYLTQHGFTLDQTVISK